MNLKSSMNLTQNSQFEITGINVTIPLSENILQNKKHIEKESTTEYADEFIDDVEDVSNISELDNSSEKIPNDDYSDDEVVISNVVSNSMLFFPLTSEHRNELSDYIGLPRDNSDNIVSESILNAPKSTKKITGDGNCFFRSLCYSLTLSEDSHRKVRLSIVKHMKNYPNIFTNLLSTGFESIDDYIKSSRMRVSGTWSSEIEILAAAHLLQCDIYTYSDNRWLKFSPLQIDNDRYRTDGIYLNHTNQNHYDVVLDVYGSRYTCIENKSGNNDFQYQNIKPSLNSSKRKKRGSNWTPKKKSKTFSVGQSNKLNEKVVKF